MKWMINIFLRVVILSNLINSDQKIKMIDKLRTTQKYFYIYMIQN